MSSIVIATRESPLALWQAHHVVKKLINFFPKLDITLLPVSTEADLRFNTPIPLLGGKGVFVKALEKVILSGRADIAVHSLKDVPSVLPKGLCLDSFLKREDPRDVLVLKDSVNDKKTGLRNLVYGGKVGTSSLRRQSQLLAMRPDISPVMIRGNLQTRLKKLQRDDLDALILASAGLKRLGLCVNSISLPYDEMLPAGGQGILAIERRSSDIRIKEMVACLNDEKTQALALAERAVSTGLETDCMAPIASFADLFDDKLRLRALVARPDGSEIIRMVEYGSVKKAEEIGYQVAENLLKAGARELLGKTS